MIHKIKKGSLKKWALLSAVMGFMLCAILGQEIVLEYGFLDEASLTQILDTSINQYAYFYYCLSKQAIVLGFFAICWYKGLGQLASRIFVVTKALQLGVCLQVCLMRYGLLGLILWIALYMPHTFFYAIFYGFIIWIVTQNIEKTKLLYVMLIASFFLSIYLESHTNVDLLQSFLEKISF